MQNPIQNSFKKNDNSFLGKNQKRVSQQNQC